jgi:3-deoxy-D-manno-octulosonic-acid transferase
MKKPNAQGIAYRIWRYLYTIILMLCLPVLLLLMRKKLKMPSINTDMPHRSFKERLGLVSASFQSGGLLIHCASVGEINAAQGLIKDLLASYPHLTITLCCSSTTGAVHAFNLFKNKVQHHYLPFDLPFFMAPFFKRLDPELVLVTEVEIWPNMLAQCYSRDIPVCLVNARLSDASFATYKRLSALLRPALRHFTFICAQSQSSYDNFLKLGVYKPNLRLTQNMKFDLSPNPADEDKAQRLLQDFALHSRPVLVAASTHDGEEKFILQVYKQLRESTPSLALIIVPRHPHRFDDVYYLLKASGFELMRATQLDAQPVDTADVILMDKMGWLKACYSICDIAFIGGSIASKGGHNALECALYGKPMVMGPSTYNNPTITQFLVNQGALHIVEDVEPCVKVIHHWLMHPDIAVLDGDKGKQVLNDNAGAVAATMKVLSPLLLKEGNQTD